MTIRRVPGSKTWRVRRYVPGVGSIERTLKTIKKGEARYREGVVVKLIKAGALETLRLFKAGTLQIEDLVDADRHGRLEQVADNIRLQRPLAEAIDGWLPQSAPAKQSRRRYETSWKRFQKVGHATKQLPADATIYHLARIDYHKMRHHWGTSGSDWNKARAMISSFLTTYLGHLHHPFRLQVMGRLPAAREKKGRMPQETPEDFWSVVMAAPGHAQASYVAMAVLGVGPKEYLGIRQRDLNADQLTVVVNGTKSEHRQRVVAVDERFWGWIERAVPSRLQYRWLGVYWNRAREKAGCPELRMYDLRHLSAQYAGDRGVTDRDLTIHLGHSNPKMTHVYSRRGIARGIAKAIADSLEEGQVRGQVRGQ